MEYIFLKFISVDSTGNTSEIWVRIDTIIYIRHAPRFIVAKDRVDATSGPGPKGHMEIHNTSEIRMTDGVTMYLVGSPKDILDVLYSAGQIVPTHFTEEETKDDHEK